MLKPSSFLALAVSAAGVLFVACAEDASDPLGGPSPGVDSGTSKSDSGDNEEEPETDSGSSTKDSGACGALQAPNLTGPKACGASDFGKPAAGFTGVDAGDGSGFTGGTLPPGIYDVIGAERESGNSGSWRETIVVGANGRFTRTRQIEASAGNVGPMTYRSGTLTTNGSSITFAEDCYVNGDAGAEAGTTTLPYKVVKDACGDPTLQYSFTGFRFTLVPRRQP